MKKSQILIVGFVCVFILLCFAGVRGQAAESTAKLNKSKMTIGTGSYKMASDHFWDKTTKYCIKVSNAEKNAVYTFSSSDTAVVTVKTSGKKAYLTGIKAGKATITCKQKLNGKITTIGTCKITVNASKLKTKYAYNAVGTGITEASMWNPFVVIERYNPNATYTFVVNKSGLNISEVIGKVELPEDTYSDYKGYSYYAQKIEATKPGIYKVTVKETYKGKTRKVGTVEVTVLETQVKDKAELLIGTSKETISDWQLMEYGIMEQGTYFYRLPELQWILREKDISGARNSNEITNMQIDEDGDVSFVAKSRGSVWIDAYHVKDVELKDKIGSVKLTVTSVDESKLQYNEMDGILIGYMYVGETKQLRWDCWTEIDGELERVKPENVMVMSDDGTFGDGDNIVKIYDRDYYWEIEALQPGAAAVMFQYGDFVRYRNFIVFATIDEYWDYTEMLDEEGISYAD